MGVRKETALMKLQCDSRAVRVLSMDLLLSHNDTIMHERHLGDL